MGYYAVFLDLERRPCVVVGEGEVVERKVDGLVRTGAAVTVISPRPGTVLETMAKTAGVTLVRRSFAKGDLSGVFLAIAVPADVGERDRIAEEARVERCLLNVVDVPEHSDFIAPALLERGELQIAVSSSGGVPALASSVRDRLAEYVGPEYAETVRLLRDVRERLRATEPSAAERARVLRDLARSEIPERLRKGDRAGVRRILEAALGRSVDDGAPGEG